MSQREAAMEAAKKIGVGQIYDIEYMILEKMEWREMLKERLKVLPKQGGIR